MGKITFLDGDVDVLLSPREEHQCRLHAQVLRETSTLFNEMVAKQYEANLVASAKRSGKVTYHIELNEPPSPTHRAGTLVRKVR